MLIAEVLSSRRKLILLVNFGPEVAGEADILPEIPEASSDYAELHTSFMLSSKVRIGILHTCPFSPDLMPGFLDRAHRGHTLIVNIRGYDGLKRRASLIFQEAVKFGFNQVALSLRYGDAQGCLPFQVASAFKTAAHHVAG